MVKLRIMGTPNDIKWFVKLIHRHKKIKVNCTSDNLPVAWYDGIWQIGMLLPIILIYFYNGESGKKNIVNKWSFYLFYPIHFLALWLILKA